ncbi:MAG: SCO family protein [Anaerolineales bacterium]|nr:SCO family protein [Anaerolineales bacterium]
MTTRVENGDGVQVDGGKRPLWPLALVGISLGLIIGVAILYFTNTWPFATPPVHGMLIDSPYPVSNFTLTNAAGEDVSLSDFKGKVVLLYFGYTYCPDVCPATMSELQRAAEALGGAADEVQVLMISVDPLRDTPESLQAYVDHFNPAFIGLTGTEDEILAATTPLGVFFEKHEGTVKSGYLIDHTATVTVVDKDGYLRLVYPFGVAGEDMAADLRSFIRE